MTVTHINLQKEFLSNEDWKRICLQTSRQRRNVLQKEFLSNEDWKITDDTESVFIPGACKKSSSATRIES